MVWRETAFCLNTSESNFSETKVKDMPVVVLKMKKGASTEQKRQIVREFTDTLCSTRGLDKNLVTIMIDEHELENIGKAGKLRCDP